MPTRDTGTTGHIQLVELSTIASFPLPFPERLSQGGRSARGGVPLQLNPHWSHCEEVDHRGSKKKRGCVLGSGVGRTCRLKDVRILCMHPQINRGSPWLLTRFNRITTMAVPRLSSVSSHLSRSLKQRQYSLTTAWAFASQWGMLETST